MNTPNTPEQNDAMSILERRLAEIAARNTTSPEPTSAAAETPASPVPTTPDAAIQSAEEVKIMPTDEASADVSAALATPEADIESGTDVTAAAMADQAPVSPEEALKVAA